MVLLGGLMYEYQFKNKVSFGIDAMFTQRGFKNDLVFKDNFGQPTGEKYKSNFDYDYFSLPIKAGYTLGNKLQVFTNIEFVPSYIVSAKMSAPTIDVTGKPLADFKINVVKNITKIDYAGAIDLGANYKLNQKFLLVGSISYQNSFNILTNANYLPSSKIFHSGLTIALGTKYLL